MLLAYENEAITAQQKGEDLDYVVPDETILIENPIAVTKDAKNPRGARRSSTDLATPGAEDLRREGLPPGDRGARRREDATRRRSGSSRSTKFGGWDAVMTKFFDPDKGRSCGDREGPRCQH